MKVEEEKEGWDEEVRDGWKGEEGCKGGQDVKEERVTERKREEGEG